MFDAKENPDNDGSVPAQSHQNDPLERAIALEVNQVALNFISLGPACVLFVRWGLIKKPWPIGGCLSLPE